MHALIVLAHPETHSLNGHLKDVAIEELRRLRYTVEVSDLYAAGFDPVEAPRHFTDRVSRDRFDVQSEQRHAFDTGRTAPDVQAEIDKLSRADLLILQFPIWWFAAPAILKGWLDRVFVYGLYSSRRRYDAGLFKGKKAFVSVTAGGPETSFRHDGRNGDIDLVLWPVNFTLHYMGYSVLPQHAVFGVDAKLGPPEGLSACAEALRQKLQRVSNEEPLKFNGWSDWDESGRLKPSAPWYNHFIRVVK
ncbi:NAD(P)H-dependent oxidoreductase [Rhizobium sp. WYJ-E13]|uniref:NAD(P)H-dependent oxidoreductase n=1 Tax=Rhizobium sp. WYJ-E13 TaxID=2849093 RepID=UPI001C1F0D3E|nr:NAD(P)H-dependent oxidoreductase [Rhizobium sp. WYJ-E13]QWW72396.1 NAD(P)H-dependent oxidoreductase [Rhizobium sp. WYJ-E13]